MNTKKNPLIKFFDAESANRLNWRKKNKYYYDDINKLYRFLVNNKSNVLEVGCGTGELLGYLSKNNKCKCTGIDFSSKMISIAKKRFTDIKFYVADAENFSSSEKFDIIILSDIVGLLPDVQKVLTKIRSLCTSETRIILNFYNFLWEPAVRVSRKLRLASNSPTENWLSFEDISNLLELSGFEFVKKGHRLLLPKYLPLISNLLNKYVARLPIMKHLCLYTYVVARPIGLDSGLNTVSVVIPARNERDNIENAITRLPKMGKKTEIIFIEGGSSDGTYEEIVRVAKKYTHLHIKYAKQIGKGKGDAVRKGFDMATGDVLMILDADLTVPPEDLPKFYYAISSNKGEFINGTRLVYSMEDKAMRTLNLFGNKMFSIIFTWLLDQRFKDTLCGTKVISKKNYNKLKENRLYFGDFDPFGDFDLIFGASKLNLKIVEIPVKYRARVYGETNIQRFKHGWLLIMMSLFAMKKIKFI